MDSSLKPCGTCTHHAGKTSIDDVAPECFPCVWSAGKTGYYSNYTPMNQETLAKFAAAQPGEIVSLSEEEVHQVRFLHKDNVMSPSHYCLRPGLEVWHVRDALLEKMEGKVNLKQADSWSRSWEYLTRAFLKNGREDLLKARQYLDRLIEETK